MAEKKGVALDALMHFSDATKLKSLKLPEMMRMNV